MGAVFPPAPTFPVPIQLPVRAIFSFPGGSGSGLKILRSQHRFPLGFPTRHCCLAGPPRNLRRNISASSKPLSLSLRPKAPVPLDGLESGSGFGLRLCLTLLPRSPYQCFVATFTLANVHGLPALAATLRFFRFRSAALAASGKVGLGTPPHNVNLPVDN